MPVDFAADITHVSYKEVAILWGLSPEAATKRLTVIRSALKKNRFHRLTILQYCKAEDITPDEFSQAINRYFNLMHKRAS